MRGQGKGIEDLKDESPFKAKKYTVVKQWSFEDSKFKRVARPDIYKSSMTKSFYDIIIEEKERKRKEDERKRMVGSAFELDENDALSTRPQSAMASPSYLRDSGLNTKVWTKRPYSARCERPGDHTPRKPFFTPGSKSHTSRFKEKASERIVYFHELDSQSKLVQSKRFMLERLGGQHKNRTLSRPQSADTWRRHHYGTKRKTSKLNDLLTIRTMDVHQQPSYEDRL